MRSVSHAERTESASQRCVNVDVDARAADVSPSSATPFAEQLAAYARADVVVAAHGQSMAMAPAMREGALLVEVFADASIEGTCVQVRARARAPDDGRGAPRSAAFRVRFSRFASPMTSRGRRVAVVPRPRRPCAALGRG